MNNMMFHLLLKTKYLDSMSKTVNDFNSKDQDAINNYLKQLEQERLEYLKDEQAKQELVQRIKDAENQLKNESKQA